MKRDRRYKRVNRHYNGFEWKATKTRLQELKSRFNEEYIGNKYRKKMGHYRLQKSHACSFQYGQHSACASAFQHVQGSKSSGPSLCWKMWTVFWLGWIFPWTEKIQKISVPDPDLRIGITGWRILLFFSGFQNPQVVMNITYLQVHSRQSSKITSY